MISIKNTRKDAGESGETVRNPLDNSQTTETNWKDRWDRIGLILLGVGIGSGLNLVLTHIHISFR